jgi:hypothetical protein
MPTRRILVVIVGTVVLTNLTLAAMKGAAARRVAEGRGGAVTQALLLI